MPKQPDQNQKFHALIVAAGRGARMANETPKQYMKIAGKTILRHAAEALQTHSACKSVRIVIHPDDAKSYHAAVNGLEIEPYTIGSNSRNLSVFNGLKSFSNIPDDELILIHDAARPCLTHAEIDDLLDALESSRAATLAIPLSGTITRAQDTHTGEALNRENLWNLQTPQAFRYGDILKAHELALPNETYTDDTTLVSAIGIPVKLVTGKTTNIKITHAEDFEMAETILNTKAETRTGMGFDVHGFDESKSGSIRLCGIDIPHTKALKGHSDADVGLHALTDAILGAIGQGDIGRHFPPSDNTFKNMDSAIFLEKAMQMLRDEGGALINADLTLICEQPKITPHAENMRARIAEICAVTKNRINIKATTTETLGFTGRGEGIAAQAIVTISLNL